MNNKRKRCPLCGKYFDKILEYKEFIIYRHEDKEKCSAVYSDPIKIIKSNN